MLLTIFASGWEARDYLAARCENTDALRAAVADWTPERAAGVTGVPAAGIVGAARCRGEAVPQPPSQESLV
jgi:formate dehydrogenase major subunit